MVLAALALLFGLSAFASKSYAATGSGAVRFGNLSSKPAPVDEYVYAAGSTTAVLVLHDLDYGSVTTYQTLNAGSYTVDVRDAGASPSSKPVQSVGITVQPGRLYTVVPIRTASQGGQVKVLDDAVPTPQGKSLVRVIVAAFDTGKNGQLDSYTFHCSCGPGAKGNIVTSVPAGDVSAYTPIPPGTWTMTASENGTVAGSLPITLTANTYRTVVVLDGPNGTATILPLTDAVSAQSAAGGVGTGFGGTAPHGPGSPLPWLAIIGAGALLALGGGLALSRDRLRRLTTRA